LERTCCCTLGRESWFARSAQLLSPPPVSFAFRKLL
jgi:hypothetical protein